MDIQILTVSPEGSVQLPESMRKELYLNTGDQMAVYVFGDSVMLKPIRLPSSDYFKTRLDEAQAWAKSVGFQEEDVDNIIQEVRRENRI